MVALGLDFGLVVGAGYSLPWLLHIGHLLLLGCAGDCLLSGLLRRLRNLHFFAIRLRIDYVRLF